MVSLTANGGQKAVVAVGEAVKFVGGGGGSAWGGIGDLLPGSAGSLPSAKATPTSPHPHPQPASSFGREQHGKGGSNK